MRGNGAKRTDYLIFYVICLKFETLMPASEPFFKNDQGKISLIETQNSLVE